MIHAARDGLSQNSDRALDVSGRSPYELVAISASKLHGAVTHPVYRYRRARQSEASPSFILFKLFPSLNCIGSDVLRSFGNKAENVSESLHKIIGGCLRLQIVFGCRPFQYRCVNPPQGPILTAR